MMFLTRNIQFSSCSFESNNAELAVAQQEVTEKSHERDPTFPHPSVI